MNNDKQDLAVNEPTDPNAVVRQWAQAYIDGGFNLIRLHQIKTDDLSQTTCGCWRRWGKDKHGNNVAPCTLTGKHPVDKKDQRPDYRRHDDLFELQLDAGQFDNGYGVLLDDTGVLVIDVDIRNGGQKGLERLIADYPEIAGAGLVVESGCGDGSRHYYFRVPQGAKLKQGLPEYVGIDFKTTGWVVGVGSGHKSGGTYTTSMGVEAIDDIDDAPVGLVEHLRKPVRAPRTSAMGDIENGTAHKVAEQALSCISPDCEYVRWIAIGGILSSAFGDDSGFDLWDHWSAMGKAYDETNMMSHWGSFGDMTGTLDDLLAMAQQEGIPDVPPVPDGALFAHDPHEELREAIAESRQAFTKDKAQEIWESATPTEGTAAESWLAQKGIDHVSAEAVRYHPDEGGMIVAKITIAGQPTGGVVRTYMDGRESRQLGPCSGGAVDLGGDGPILLVNAPLAAMWLASQINGVRVMATLGDRNLKNLDVANASGGEAVSFASASTSDRDAATELSWTWQHGGAGHAGVKILDLSDIVTAVTNAGAGAGAAQ